MPKKSQLEEFRTFWRYVRADRGRTVRFFVLLGVLLLMIAVIMGMGAVMTVLL